MPGKPRAQEQNVTRGVTKNQKTTWFKRGYGEKKTNGTKTSLTAN